MFMYVIVTSYFISDHGLKLPICEASLFGRIVIITLSNIGKRGSWYGIEELREGPAISLDMPVILRCFHNSPLKIDSIIQANLFEHVPPEILCVISMDHGHKAPTRPIGVHTDSFQPFVFGKDRSQEAHANRSRAWCV